MTTTPTPSPIGDSLLRERAVKAVRVLRAMLETAGLSGGLTVADELLADLAQHRPQWVGAPVPDGYALVPSRMHIGSDTWEALQFAFGGPGTSEGEPFNDCTLWVGQIDSDGDMPAAWGMHLSCDECPEEGSITVAAFAAPTAPVSPALPYGWVEPETGNFAFHADVERCRKVRPNDYASWSVPVFAELRERNEGGGEAVAAWRGVNELGEVVTEWQDGAPPAILYDLCGSSPTNYASVQVAYTHPAPTAPVSPDDDHPEIHGYDPGEHRSTITVRWPDGVFLAYALDRSKYTDALPPLPRERNEGGGGAVAWPFAYVSPLGGYCDVNNSTNFRMLLDMAQRGNPRWPKDAILLYLHPAPTASDTANGEPI